MVSQVRQVRCEMETADQERSLRPTLRSINACIIAAGNSGDAVYLLDTIAAWEQEMNLVNLATSWHRLAKILDTPEAFRALLGLQEANSDSIGRLMASTEKVLRERLPLSQGFSQEELRSVLKGVSNITWAMGVLRWERPSLLDALVLWHEWHMKSFLPFELASSAWAFASCSFEHRHCEVRTADIMMASSLYVGGEAVLKTGFRALVMILWACAVRGCNIQLVTDVFLPRAKPMLKKADLTRGVTLELIEAFHIVCSKMTRRKFCWMDIISHTLRSIKTTSWAPDGVVHITVAFFQRNVYVPELASLVQQYFANNQITKNQFLSVIKSCCNSSHQVGEWTALPVLQVSAADGLMTLLNPFEFPWTSFDFQELGWLTSVVASQFVSGLCKGAPFHDRVMKKTAREFLRTACGYLLCNPADLSVASGESLAQIVAAYANVSLPGDKPFHDLIQAEVTRRIRSNKLHPKVRASIFSFMSASARPTYEGLLAMTRETTLEEVSPGNQESRMTPNSYDTSTTGNEGQFESSVSEDIVGEINWCSVKNSFLEFGHVQEAVAAPAPVLEFVLDGTSWLEVTDFRMQLQYYGLV